MEEKITLDNGMDIFVFIDDSMPDTIETYKVFC